MEEIGVKKRQIVIGSFKKTATEYDIFVLLSGPARVIFN